MNRFTPHLDWIDTQRGRMVGLLTDWANINSGSENVAGLAAMAAALGASFAGLGGELRVIEPPPFKRLDTQGRWSPVPVGPMVSIRKRSQTSLRVFLGIHSDTVYAADNPFQKTELIDATRLRGPGVADAKGGLVVMLLALEALERSPFADGIGWEVLMNSDEEIGSPASAELFADAAKRNHLGLLFEPAMDEAGTLAGARKGSGNFTIIVRGRAAHAGRDFSRGRNAVAAAAELAVALHELTDIPHGVTVNIGRIEGGGPVNVVPDLALIRFNTRITEQTQAAAMTGRFNELVAHANAHDGIAAELHGGFHALPKPITLAMQQLFDCLSDCGCELGLPIRWQSSGGVSDGNRLAAAGLPNVDSLGVRGGAIHSSDEYVLLDSLPERARLTALLLMRLAGGDLSWNPSPPASR